MSMGEFLKTEEAGRACWGYFMSATAAAEVLNAILFTPETYPGCGINRVPSLVAISNIPALFVQQTTQNKKNRFSARQIAGRCMEPSCPLARRNASACFLEPNDRMPSCCCVRRSIPIRFRFIGSTQLPDSAGSVLPATACILSTQYK